MPEDAAKQPALDQLIANDIAGDDVREAARRAFIFLAACADGEIAEAKVSDRIMAARTILEHAARLPDLLGEVAALADLASEDDLALIVTALE
jgi:hypothetical protein